MSKKIKRTVVSDGDELPVRENEIIHRRVLDKKEPDMNSGRISPLSSKEDQKVRLEIWYVEKEKAHKY